MTIIDIFSLVASIFSVALAVIAIWIALHHKKESDSLNQKMTDVLADIRTDAKAINQFAGAELKDWGKWARSGGAFNQKSANIEKGFIADSDRRSSTNATNNNNIESTLDKLEELSIKLRDGEGFTNHERDRAVSLLRMYHNKDGDLDNPIFTASLERIIDAFAAADQDKFLDFLFELFKDVVLNTDGILQTLCLSYGMRYLGSDNINPTLKEKFYQIAIKAHNLGRPEFCLDAELVAAYLEGDQSKLDQLISLYDSLDITQKIILEERFEQRTDPSKVALIPTKKVTTMTDRYSSFLEEYGEQLGING